MHWQLLLEEFGPKLTHMEGPHNVIANALSQMENSKEEFSEEAFAASEETGNFPTEFPLSYCELALWQEKDKSLQKKVKDQPEDFTTSTYRQGD